MKLNRVDNREPQQVRVLLPAATYDKLHAYLEYANSNGQGFADLKQLIAEICRAFVANGDKDFAQWLAAESRPLLPSQNPRYQRSRSRVGRKMWGECE